MSYEFDHQKLPLWPAVFLMFFFTLLVLAMFNSQALVTASYDLPPGSVSDSVAGYAENWNANMQQLGIASVSEAIGEWFQMLRDAPVTDY